MKDIARNILALPFGIFVGGFLNMMIISIGPTLIPPPQGADLSSMEGLAEAMKNMEFKHFIMPFLAHALGSFAGAFLTGLIAGKRRMAQSLIVGALFFVGGFMMVMKLPSPIWFNVVDLTFAYFPMALLGYFISKKIIRGN